MLVLLLFFFFKQKTAYEMRISDWSSDVCSSDLTRCAGDADARDRTQARRAAAHGAGTDQAIDQSRRRPARQAHGDGCGVRLAPLRARTQHLADRQQPRGPRRKSDGGGDQGERRMSLNTPLTELPGCRYPVLQTAMGWVADRSEERRVGKGCVSTCRSGGVAEH